MLRQKTNSQTEMEKIIQNKKLFTEREMMQKKISSEIPRNNKKDKIDQKRDKTT